MLQSLESSDGFKNQQEFFQIPNAKKHVASRDRRHTFVREKPQYAKPENNLTNRLSLSNLIDSKRYLFHTVRASNPTDDFGGSHHSSQASRNTYTSKKSRGGGLNYKSQASLLNKVGELTKQMNLNSKALGKTRTVDTYAILSQVAAKYENQMFDLDSELEASPQPKNLLEQHNEILLQSLKLSRMFSPKDQAHEMHEQEKQMKIDIDLMNKSNHRLLQFTKSLKSNELSNPIRDEMEFTSEMYESSTLVKNRKKNSVQIQEMISGMHHEVVAYYKDLYDSKINSQFVDNLSEMTTHHIMEMTKLYRSLISCVAYATGGVEEVESPQCSPESSLQIRITLSTLWKSILMIIDEIFARYDTDVARSKSVKIDNMAQKY